MYYAYKSFIFSVYLLSQLIGFVFSFDNSEMDKQKATLLDAYVRKAIALGKLGLIEKSETKKESFAVFDLNEFNDIYVDVGRFIEYTDTKV